MLASVASGSPVLRSDNIPPVFVLTVLIGSSRVAVIKHWRSGGKTGRPADFWFEFAMAAVDREAFGMGFPLELSRNAEDWGMIRNVQPSS